MLAPDGTLCDDGDPCTADTTCDGGGECGGGDPQLCIDDFKCYKAKDLKDPQFVSTLVDLVDQFQSTTDEVKKPFLLCNPSDTNGAGTVDPAAHLTCYKIKGQKLNPSAVVDASNTLGDLRLEVKKPFLLCVPSTKTVLP